MKDFSLIPRELFYKTNDRGLIKKYNNDKILLVVDYLNGHKLKNNKVEFVLKYLIQIYGFTLNTHKDGINQQFKDALEILEKLKFIKNPCILIPLSFSKKKIFIKDITINDYIECDFDILSKISKNGKEKDTNFIQLFQWEVNKILTYKDDKEKVDTTKMLVYYCYLKARINRRSKEQGDRVMSGGKAEVCYPSFDTICKDINITSKIIMKYNEILVSIDMIRYMNAGLWHYKNESKKYLRESNNTYMLYEDNWETELKDSIKCFKEFKVDERVFEGNSYKDNNRKINGFIGRINFLEKNGKATEEQIKKRDEYLRMKENKDGDD